MAEFNKRKLDKNVNKSADRYTDRKNINRPKDEEKVVKKPVVKSMCPVFGKCGGCQMLDMPYAEQLKKKQQIVDAALESFGKVDKIIGMENPMHYRNKVHATFDHDKKGNAVCGTYEEKSHRVVAIDSCFLDDKKADEIIVSIRDLLKSFKIKTYDEDTGYGLLRHVLVRVGKNSGQVMVVLVLSNPILPGKANFVKVLRTKHPEINTIVINVNNRKTSMILGDKEQVIFGKGYIEDTLCGKTFKISPKSFYQINPVQTEKLYGKAVEFAGLTGKETVLDAYSGIGTIGMIASDKAKKVISVELNKDAVRDAVTNAKLNQISNIDIYNKDAGEFMVQLAQQNVKIDTVFMDPPRSGSDETFLSHVVTLAPKKIVYVSCNPLTLARDLKYLTKKGGYRMEKAVPVDMFAATVHVETIVALHRTNS